MLWNRNHFQTEMRFLQGLCLLVQYVYFATDFDCSFWSGSILKAWLFTSRFISSTEKHLTEAPETTNKQLDRCSVVSEWDDHPRKGSSLPKTWTTMCWFIGFFYAGIYAVNKENTTQVQLQGWNHPALFAPSLLFCCWHPLFIPCSRLLGSFVSWKKMMCFL